jgi:choline dehydrogenase-like flavoprotein
MSTRIALDDDSVAVIVGSGAGGGTLAHELCRLGKRVVCLEAGPRLSAEDFKNDELFAFMQLTWRDPRTSSGTWSVARSSPTLPVYTVKAVGGTTIHWGALAFRLQPHELRARERYGRVDGAALTDWPVSHAELAPWWGRAERRMGVTGTHGLPRLPVTNNYKVFDYGARRAGYRHVDNDRHAINSVPRDGRPACLQLGFCGQGCKSTAKWSTLYTEIPQAEATGRLDLRPGCMVVQVEHDARGRASGVVYVDPSGVRQRQRAALVVIAGNAIETPRLLLNSASATFPQGLANGSGWVGRGYMKHLNASLWGRFEKPVRMNHGVQMGGTIYDEARLDASRGFLGGYLMQAVQVGVPFLTATIVPNGWGSDFTRFVDNYDHLSGIWLNGEDLPRADNRVTLHPTEKDAFGLPVANVHVDEHPNDIAMRSHFFRQAETVLRAAGATEVMAGAVLPSSHNMGTCRMSAAAVDGVTDAFGRAHEVPNLFVCDGSLFPTSTAQNPTLTIVALALRQAALIAGPGTRPG